MARHLNWKATVVLNLLLCLSSIAFAQSTITYSCRAERLENVIDFLSKNTSYDFIYSRDLIDVSKKISLTVTEKSIHEVLGLIEKQTNVSFKLKDHHIIVKSVASPPVSKMIVPAPAPPKGSGGPYITSLSRSVPAIPFESRTEAIEKDLDKRINEVQKLLGAGAGKSIPPFYINQINYNNRHRSWFASLGTYVSDDLSGLEIQAGLPFAYAVFQPHYSPRDGFHASYGIGNSLNLAGNFSFNTIYMFSGRNTTDISYPLSGPLVPDGPAVCTTQNIRQHQLKMTVQYSFSKNLAVRVGPVLNYRSTTTEVSIVPSSVPIEAYPVYGSYSVIGSQRTPSVMTFRTTRNFESWIGWDASIQYRINFFENK